MSGAGAGGKARGGEVAGKKPAVILNGVSPWAQAGGETQ